MLSLPPMPRSPLMLLILISFAAAGCNFRTLATSEPSDAQSAPVHPRPVPDPDPAALALPDRFHAEPVVTGLIYPTSAEFDDRGNLYIAEAGFVYGDHRAPARVLRVSPRGDIRIHATDLTGPVNDLLFHNGRLYVSHRGKISTIEDDGTVRDLMTGLPSLGDHQNNQLTAGKDGWIYFGQGTATNSGVVGLDNFATGWLISYPQFHDQPAHDIQLAGEEFTTVNPFILAGGELPQLSITGAFQPFGTSDTGTVQGVTKANGTILRMRPDGSDLQVYAWGFRNPYGGVFGSDGNLYAAENGFDERGSRPVANDVDDLYRVEQGSWYGWPDYAAGIPVTDPRFEPEDGPAPEFLMASHPPVEKPLLTFPSHSGVTKLAPNRGGDAFGNPNDLFLAVWGPLTPFSGHLDQPEGTVGRRVLRISPQTGNYETFVSNAADTVSDTTAGLRRPIDVVFGPDGKALYLVDMGTSPVLETPVPVPAPRPGTGVLWRIVPDDREVQQPPAGLSVVPRTARP